VDPGVHIKVSMKMVLAGTYYKSEAPPARIAAGKLNKGHLI
jgi:hypothetical protein